MSDSKQSGLARNPAVAVAGAAVGAIFVWYDFFLYVSLSGLIASHFFSTENPAAAYGYALLVFAAGFVMRPLGAALFGRMSDLRGRKRVLVITLLLTGVSSLLVAVTPDGAVAGVFGPIALVLLRLVQGLALGGEYGASATIVAELAPAGRRGLYTSFIQVAAPLGLILSLAVVLAARGALGQTAFEDWGWRAPFLVSAVLLAVSVWIRSRLEEGRVFETSLARDQAPGKPLAETLASSSGVKSLLLAVLGLAAGAAVVAYTGQVYALSYLEGILRLDAPLAESLFILALALGAPFFILFGWLSDKIGRKWIIMAGCALAAVTYLPLFHGLEGAANPRIAEAKTRSAVVLVADPKACSVQFDPVGATAFTSSCDVARAYLVKSGIPFRHEPAYAGQLAGVQVGESGASYIDSFNGAKLSPGAFEAARKTFASSLATTLTDAGYPAGADTTLVNKPMVVGILLVMGLYTAMVGGPLAAMLAEVFPTRRRASALGLASQIGESWFGGLMPSMVFALVAATGNPTQGLWWPIFFAALSVIVGGINLGNPRKVDLAA